MVPQGYKQKQLYKSIYGCKYIESVANLRSKKIPRQTPEDIFGLNLNLISWQELLLLPVLTGVS